LVSPHNRTAALSPNPDGSTIDDHIIHNEHQTSQGHCKEEHHDEEICVSSRLAEDSNESRLYCGPEKKFQLKPPFRLLASIP
jgi:hypothetical protein